VNSALETQLIPSASNGELKSLLQTGLKIIATMNPQRGR
jgi:putative membrane protein